MRSIWRALRPAAPPIGLVFCSIASRSCSASVRAEPVTEAPELWWSSGSGPARRVQIALLEKGVAYVSHEIELTKKQQKQPPVTSLNPRGQIPVLKHGDAVVCESLAGVLYVDSSFPGVSLVPCQPPSLKAFVLQRMMETENLREAHKVAFRAVRGSDAEAIRIAMSKLRSEMDIWEAHLASAPSGGYICGEEFTAADCALAPPVLFCHRIGFDFGPYPSLAAYIAKLEARPSVQMSTPPHWRKGPGPRNFAAL